MPTEKPAKTTKPRKAPAKKKTEAVAVAAAAPESVVVAAEPIVIRPNHEQIAALAHKYWAERGYSHGHSEHDWLRAESELLKSAS